MRANYPNLELLEYKTLIAFKENKELFDKFKDAKAKHGRFTNLDFVVEVFSQIWGSSCIAFDVCEDGSPAIGGSAMTEAYTVVFHERLLDFYFVYVDNKLCYFIENANQIFLDDLKEHRIKPLSEAKNVY